MKLTIFIKNASKKGKNQLNNSNFSNFTTTAKMIKKIIMTLF